MKTFIHRSAIVLIVVWSALIFFDWPWRLQEIDATVLELCQAFSPLQPNFRECVAQTWSGAFTGFLFVRLGLWMLAVLPLGIIALLAKPERTHRHRAHRRGRSIDGRKGT